MHNIMIGGVNEGNKCIWLSLQNSLRKYHEVGEEGSSGFFKIEWNLDFMYPFVIFE